MSENEYTISQVSNITGVSTSAINYYVRLNIIEPPKKTAKKKIIKKGNQKLKGKTKKQQAYLPSAEKIRKEKNKQIKIDPELIGRVLRYWLRER